MGTFWPAPVCSGGQPVRAGGDSRPWGRYAWGVAKTSARAGGPGAGGERSERRIRQADSGAAREAGAATSRATETVSLDSLVVRLRDVLKADLVFVGELRGERADAIGTVAVASSDGRAENFEFVLADTPSAPVIAEVESATHPSGVAAQFPQDTRLVEMGIEAYVGVPLRGPRGEPTGVVVALFRDPLTTPSHVEFVLELAASQVSGELNRSAPGRDYEQLLHDARERVKELQGLYGVARAAAESPNLETFLQRACEVIGPAWHYPEFTRVRLVVDGEEYVSEPFEPTPWKQAADIVVQGAIRGAIEVYYLREFPELDEGPFLAEERSLIDGLAHLVGLATAQGAVEAELRASEEKYRIIAENAADVIWTTDLDLHPTFISPSVLRLGGYTVEEAMHQPLSETMSEKSYRELTGLLARQVQLVEAGDDAGWDSVSLEAVRRCKDGTSLSTELSARLVKGSDGQPTSIVGATHDITTRKRNEETLRESREEYNRLFESSSDAIVSAEPPLWNLVLANPAAARMFEADDPEHFAARPPWEHSPEFQPDGRRSIDKGREMIESALRDGSTSFKWRHKRASGEEFNASVTLTRIELSGAAWVQATIRDLSQAEREEEERGRLEDQYRQAQKMEAVGLLAGGVAHDFNNLLTVINSYAGFAIDDLREGDPLRADMREILQAGERAAVLTRQLLAFSRKQVMDPAIVDLNAVVGNLEKMLKRLLGEDVDFSTAMAEDIGHINADPGQIDQVVMNLVVNARDAMPKGGKLTIKTANVELDDRYAREHPDTPAGSYVMLSVTDTGRGIPDEIKERIFEPFYTTKAEGRGTGLGLSTVYGIIKQTGGAIDVVSEVGKGSTFTVLLPRVEAPLEQPRRTSFSAPRQNTETVLVVEDEAAVRNLTERILVSAGFTVLTAANGGEALIECERHRGKIHLLVTDVVMPKMSGKDVADRLTQNAPDLRVLYMSGYTGDTILRHGVRARGACFVSKPFEAGDLINKVRAVLDQD